VQKRKHTSDINTFGSLFRSIPPVFVVKKDESKFNNCEIIQKKHLRTDMNSYAVKLGMFEVKNVYLKSNIYLQNFCQTA